MILLMFVLLLTWCSSWCEDASCYEAKAKYEEQLHQQNLELQKQRDAAMIEKQKLENELYNSPAYINKQQTSAAQSQASSLNYLETSQQVRDAIWVAWFLFNVLSD